MSKVTKFFTFDSLNNAIEFMHQLANDGFDVTDYINHDNTSTFHVVVDEVENRAYAWNIYDAFWLCDESLPSKHLIDMYKKISDGLAGTELSGVFEKLSQYTNGLSLTKGVHLIYLDTDVTTAFLKLEQEGFDVREVDLDTISIDDRVIVLDVDRGYAFPVQVTGTIQD